MTETALLRALAFLHPAWMVASLGVALATAGLGLEIRRGRLAGRPVGGDRRRRHLRLGRIALAMIAAGFVTGPLSMLWLRDRGLFESLHGVLGVIVLGLFAWTGWSGRRLARGDAEARSIHRLAAGASLGAALLSAVAGFILLP